jgi:hypothetical protein
MFEVRGECFIAYVRRKKLDTEILPSRNDREIVASYHKQQGFCQMLEYLLSSSTVKRKNT